MPTPLAPAIFASWPTSDPTGPLAAATTTVSPGAGLPITRRPPYAVNPGIPSTPSPVVTGATAGSSLRRSARSDGAWVAPSRVGKNDVAFRVAGMLRDDHRRNGLATR